MEFALNIAASVGVRMLWACSGLNSMVFFSGSGLKRGSSEVSTLGLCFVVWLMLPIAPVSIRHCPDFVTWSDDGLVLVLGFGTGGGRTFTTMMGFSSIFSVFVLSSFSTYSLLGLGWLIEMLERA